MSDRDLLLMGDFFNQVSGDYEEVHKSHIDRGDEYYQAIAMSIEQTTEPVNVLDIGCGSGLELESVLAKLPNAQVTCVDLSQMLANKLLEKYAGRNFRFFLDSYLARDYPSHYYQYVIASATLHHLVDAEKQVLYTKLHKALTKLGCMVVGDYFVSAEEAVSRLEGYTQLLAAGKDLKNGKYHFDVPTTIDNEKKLLSQAGFVRTGCIWQSANYGIIVAYTD